MFRNFNSGDLELKPISIEQQLANKRNKLVDGKLWLDYCVGCKAENYYAFISQGICCWCYWPNKNDPKIEDLPKPPSAQAAKAMIEEMMEDPYVKEFMMQAQKDMDKE